MKWVLIILGALILLDAVILGLLRRHTKNMEKMGFWYNYDEDRWERENDE